MAYLFGLVTWEVLDMGIYDKKRAVFPLTAFLCMAAFLTACTDGKYPFSGKECGTEDPVLELDAKDCTPF